ncbi:MAG: hypothetical protein ACTSP1_18205 [Candidatus Freyarchaeota archaeon]
MPNGGSDCCATCPFNSVNSGRSWEPFCEVRGFPIEDPYWTYCGNHPRRNPLLVRSPRGPVWAAVFEAYDSKPFSEGVRIPPMLLPPAGDAVYVRIPYYRNTRPVEDGAGVCIVCGERCESAILLEPEDEERKFFCSVAHYFEWWLKSPEAAPYHDQAALDADSVKDRLGEIGRNLLGAGEVLRATGNTGQVFEQLVLLDDLRVQLGHGGIDLTHAAVYLYNPEMRGNRSPHLLRLQLTLSRAGQLLGQDPPRVEAILECLSEIREIIHALRESL